MSLNKKRKQGEPQNSIPNENQKISNTYENSPNISSILCKELSSTKLQLISLKNTISLADNSFFVENNVMVQELVGMMGDFVQYLQNHQRKVLSIYFNSDVLMNVYQFLDTTSLKNCGLVSKVWRESMSGLRVCVGLYTTIKFLKSSLIEKVSHLELACANVKAFEALSNVEHLERLLSLDLSGNNLDSGCVEYLKKCNMPNLTDLNLSRMTDFTESALIELLSSNLMKNIKKLNLTGSLRKSSKRFYESLSECENLSQITHLQMINDYPNYVSVELLLKGMVNLQKLDMEFCIVNDFSKLALYKNLKYLNMSKCCIANQEFANLLISPNLPNLETLIVRNLNLVKWESYVDKSVANFPPNSQSSITELDGKGFNIFSFPSLLNHCPKIRKLTLIPDVSITDSRLKEEHLINMMKSDNLSNLEYLDIIFRHQILENILTNPTLSNLKTLRLYNNVFNMGPFNLDYVRNCSTLVNLSEFIFAERLNYRVEEWIKAFKENPTFSNLKRHII